MADAHFHLSYGDSTALDRLVERGVTRVRDAGGDLTTLSRWRAEIAAGTRRGPRLYLSGPLLVGTDLVGLPPGAAPADDVAREVKLLRAAGLSAAEAREAGSAAALARWFRGR